MTISISPFENEYRLHAEQIVPKPLGEVFKFFSEARNLEKITPELIKFKVLDSDRIDIRTDAVIQYRLRIRGLPCRWKTVISNWNPPFEFTDEQLKGPYRYWIHRHTFEEIEGGTLMKDMVRYQVYGGFLVNALFVQEDVKKIFQYREKKIAEIFGSSDLERSDHGLD